MSDYLCIAVTFLDPRFHGRGDGGEPEWPPSPLRLLQAIVATNVYDIGNDGDLDRALKWLERQEPPLILAPTHEEGVPYCLSLPNNAMDIVAKAWSRGNYFGGGDANPAKHRTMKTIRPVRMVDGDTRSLHLETDRLTVKHPETDPSAAQSPHNGSWPWGGESTSSWPKLIVSRRHSCRRCPVSAGCRVVLHQVRLPYVC